MTEDDKTIMLVNLMNVRHSLRVAARSFKAMFVYFPVSATILSTTSINAGVE